MKKRKITAAALIFSMAGSAFLSGCSKTEEERHKKDPVYVADDTPWYTLKKTEILNEFDDKDNTSSVLKTYIGNYGGDHFFLENPMYTIPEGTEFSEMANYQDYYIVEYDEEGNLINRYDLYQMLRDEGLVDKMVDFYMVGFSLTDCISFEFDGFDYNYDNLIYNISIDPSTGKISDYEKVDLDLSSYDESSYFLGAPTVLANGNRIDIGHYDSANGILYGIKVYDKDGNGQLHTIDEIYPTEGIYSSYKPMITGDTEAVVKLKTYGDEDALWVKMDFEDCSISKLTEDMSFLDGYDIQNLDYSAAEGNIFMDGEGIMKIDLENKKVEQIFSFDSCNIDRNAIGHLKLLSYEPGKIVLLNEDVTIENRGYRGLYRYDDYIYTLTRADSNPNIGKQILTAASLTEPNPAVLSAICDFNETNEKYYLKYIDDYNAESYGKINDIGTAALIDRTMEPEEAGMLESEDTDINEFYLDAEKTMSDKLLVDLISGNGPDIILDGFSYSQLNSSDYLYDLSELTTDGDGIYFDNIINASKTGDALYQLPLGFSINCIMTPSKNVASGQVGFTFDEYENFVSDVCNGKDPMGMNRLDMITEILMESGNAYVKDGKVDYGNSSFKALCTYLNDHISDKRPSLTSQTTFFCTIDNFGLAISYGVFNDYALLGTPSGNGDGPCVNCTCSAAVSADTSSPEGCMEFISLLLSKDMQEKINSGYFPVRIDAFDETAQEAIDYNNESCDLIANEWGEQDLIMMGMKRLDYSGIDTFRNLILSCNRIKSFDAPILMIVREEVQPFFAGDKTFDEIVEIINNRAQIFIDERK